MRNHARLLFLLFGRRLSILPRLALNWRASCSCFSVLGCQATRLGCGQSLLPRLTMSGGEFGVGRGD